MWCFEGVEIDMNIGAILACGKSAGSCGGVPLPNRYTIDDISTEDLRRELNKRSSCGSGCRH